VVEWRVKDYFCLKMGMFMMVNVKMAKKRVKELITLVMEGDILDIGKMV